MKAKTIALLKIGEERYRVYSVSNTLELAPLDELDSDEVQRLCDSEDWHVTIMHDTAEK